MVHFAEGLFDVESDGGRQFVSGTRSLATLVDAVKTANYVLQRAAYFGRVRLIQVLRPGKRFSITGRPNVAAGNQQLLDPRRYSQVAHEVELQDRLASVIPAIGAF